MRFLFRSMVMSVVVLVLIVVVVFIVAKDAYDHFTKSQGTHSAAVAACSSSGTTLSVAHTSSTRYQLVITNTNTAAPCSIPSILLVRTTANLTPEVGTFTGPPVRDIGTSTIAKAIIPPRGHATAILVNLGIARWATISCLPTQSHSLEVSLTGTAQASTSGWDWTRFNIDNCLDEASLAVTPLVRQ
jgi:hypothetical protein